MPTRLLPGSVLTACLALSSLVLSVGVAAPNPLAGLAFVRWTDPQEAAYSFEVPRGWQVRGGTVRPYAGSGAVSESVMTSPDGRVTIRLGDVGLPTSFAVPNATLTSLGYGEGSRPNQSSQVLRYLPGAEFAAYYVKASLGAQCAALTRTGGQSYPDYVRHLPNIQLLRPSAYTAGDFSFTCRTNAGTLSGYAYAETYATDYQGSGAVWAVARLQGFTAPSAQVNLAFAVLAHALSTTRLNPQWFAAESRQQGLTAQMQQQSISYSATIMNTILDEHLKATQRAGTEPQKGYPAPYYAPRPTAAERGAGVHFFKSSCVLFSAFTLPRRP